jgi:hypothetical protein
MKRPFQYLDERVVKRVLLGVVLSSILLVLVMDLSNSDVRAAPGATQAVYLPLILRGGPTALPTVPPPATATPPPAGTLVPGPIVVLPNHSVFTDSYGYLNIVGEVRNTTSGAVKSIRVAANVYDSNSQLLGSDWSDTYLINLAPGDKTCFRMSSLKITSWSYYTFPAPVYSTGGTIQSLTVLNSNGYYNPTSGDYSILGQVRNDSSSLLYSLVVGTLYNSANRTVGCYYDYISSVNSGQTASFNIVFSNRDYSDVSTFAVQADVAF